VVKANNAVSSAALNSVSLALKRATRYRADDINCSTEIDEPDLCVFVCPY